MLLLHSPRLALAVTLLLLAASAVHAVDVFGRGSKLHYEETRQKAPHVERDPRWATVVRLRTLKAFYTEIRREPLCLVYFYTVWSEPSLLIAPELDKQADILWKERPGIAVFAVNLEDAPELAKEYRINTVPNFGVFRHGSLAVPNEQMVPRYPPAISGYMRSLLKDPVVVLKTLSEAEKVVDPKTKAPVMKAKPGLIPVSNPHPDDVFEKSVFLCFTDNEKYGAAIFDASRLLSVFFAIYHTENHKIAKAYGAQMDTCVLYRRWIPEQKPTVYPLEDEAQLSRKILSWLTYNAIPPMAVFDEESKPVYAMRHKPLLIYFSPGRLPSTDPLFTILAQLGSDSTLNITSTQCDPNQSGKHIAHFLGMDGSLRESNYAIGLLIGRHKYRFDSASENPTEANLRRFVKAALGGTWPEFHKSQPESAIREKGHVSDVAFTDFEKWVVQDRKNDALLLFYRPDDRHSVDVIPVFDAVAEHLKGLDIFVARFNVFENDYHTSYAIPGTPTIVYATRTNKTKPVKMGGVARTAENIEAFVAEHASVSLSGLSPSNRTPPSTPQPTPSIKQQQPPRGGEDL